MSLVEQLELKDKKIDHLTKVIIEQDEIIEQRNVMLSRAYSEYEYAKSVTVNLWEKHYKAECPNWEPCEDLLGLVSQLSNMHTGLVRIERIEALEKERNEYRGRCLVYAAAEESMKIAQANLLGKLRGAENQLVVFHDAMSKENAELHKQLAASEKQAIKATAANINLNEQLASAQAENLKFREALDIAHAHADSLGDSPEEMNIVNDARLSAPSDTTALTEYRNGVIEECAKVCAETCVDDVVSDICANRIRAMKEKP